jgi:hypothetical protein
MRSLAGSGGAAASLVWAQQAAEVRMRKQRKWADAWMFRWIIETVMPDLDDQDLAYVEW